MNARGGTNFVWCAWRSIQQPNELHTWKGLWSTACLWPNRDTHWRRSIENSIDLFQSIIFWFVKHRYTTLIMAGFHSVRAIVALPGPRHCPCWLTYIAYWHRQIKLSNHQCYLLHLLRVRIVNAKCLLVSNAKGLVKASLVILVTLYKTAHNVLRNFPQLTV